MKRFTIDDMIEFCESECEYHLKKAEMYHERFGGKRLPDECKDGYMLGMHNGFNVAYECILENLIELKEQSNDKKD